jgi:hydrogenase expression/formation protein HypE
VDESLEAGKFGLRSRGITSMHDATEGGVLGALYEIADASGNGILVEKDKLPLSPEVSRISELFGMNPYRSISEGTLLMTAVPEKAEAFVKRLKSRGIESSIVGYMKEGSFGRKIEESGILKDIEPPGYDDYWKAINYGVSRRLK